MKPKRETKEIELKPDAWERFERFVRNIAKAGPQHRAHKTKAEKPQEPPLDYHGDAEGQYGDSN